MFSGRHVDHPGVHLHRAARVRVAADGIVGYADGERVGPLPLDCEVVPGALRLLGAGAPLALRHDLDRGEAARRAEEAPASPAERYARAAARARTLTGPLGTFRQQYPFELDDFQFRACEALEDGRGVLVAAPTGAGKTIVGEFAIHLAMQTGRKAFYTTPDQGAVATRSSTISSAELRRRARSGCSPATTTSTPRRRIVVMTTEVLRNMLYADSPTLAGLGYVVMDEVHYLADRFRGAVWEEVIIHLPDDVRVVSLSATVSNAEEFGDWLTRVRGDTEVIVSEHRPVPLEQHVLVGSRLLRPVRRRTHHSSAADGSAVPVPARVNPELLRLAAGRAAAGARRAARPPSGTGRAPQLPSADGPRRAAPTSSRQLDRAGLLPAISFIFSRVGCDAAVQQCLALGRAPHLAARSATRSAASSSVRCADIPDEDLAVLGYWEWLEGLERGVAAHHAGLLPTFKEVVEELFSARAWSRSCSPPRRSRSASTCPRARVVLEKLEKFNGEAHADDHAGGVHPAHRPRRAPRHRRRGARRRALAADGLDPRGRRRARLDAAPTR